MKLIIDEYLTNIRIDSFLADYLQKSISEEKEVLSRSKLQAEIKKGAVLVNSKTVKPSYIVKEGDVVEINQSSFKIEILPENIPLDIVWEDENMLVVNKPSGMLTHPTTQECSGTLVNALLYLYGENLSDVNGEFRRGILHRLDRNTSGLLMVAKNNQTHEYLVEKMKSGEMEKKYLALVKGIVAEDNFVVNKPIIRNPAQPHKMSIANEGEGKDSISIVKVLERYKEATLVEITLVTGRTHQIRVHMSGIGHPVYNDTLYGFGKMKIKTEEQVLQSYKLTFPHPFDGKKICVEIPRDEKLTKVLKAIV